MKFFVGNPPKRRKAKKRRTAAQRRATAKMLRARKASLRKTKKAGASRRSLTTRRKRSVPMATTKRRRKSKKRVVAARRRSTARRKTTRRRRRSTGSITLRRVKGAVYKRNPGIVNTLMQGVKDAAFVFAGRTAAGMVAAKLPNVVGGNVGLMVNKGVTGVLLGLVTRKALGNDAARFVVAGAFGSIVEDVARQVLPAGLLSSYPMGRMASYPRIAAYPRVAAPVAALSGYNSMANATYDSMGIPVGG